MNRIQGFHCHGLGPVPGKGTEILQVAGCSKRKESTGESTPPTEVSFVVRCEKSTRQLLSLVLNVETNILFNIYLFLNFLMHWVFIAAHRLSLVAMPWLLTACGAQALGAVGFSSCSARA